MTRDDGKKRAPNQMTAAEVLRHQNALQRMRTWDGKIDPEDWKKALAETEAEQRENASPIPIYWPLHD